MKKIKISEDLVPLSRRERTIVSLIIVCVFQFLLFFTPVLAAEAVSQAGLTEDSVSLAFSAKGEVDPIVAAIIEQQTKQESLEIVTEERTEEAFIGPENTTQEDSEANKVEIRVISSSIRTMTAYNSLPEQTDATPCITANGFDVCKHWTEDTIAANFLKFGTKVRIPELFGDRIFIVRDRMNARYSDRVDIWMKDKQDARNFGKRTAKIEIVEVIE